MRLRRELMFAAALVAVMVMAGALIGVLWEHFAPARPVGYVISPGAIAPDESESFIATDGRFVIYTALAGLVFGVAAWSARAVRGPVIAVALVVGGLGGSVLADAVGRALGGGKANGAADSVITLQLEVHARQFLCIQAFIAVLFYAVAALFCEYTDLGRERGVGDETLSGGTYPGLAGEMYPPGPVNS